MWLGEQITERGHRQRHFIDYFRRHRGRAAVGGFDDFSVRARRRDGRSGGSFDAGSCSGCVVGAIIFVERGQRRIPVQYAKRVVGRKMYGGMSSHLPLKVNTANVIPPIFASSLLIFPATAGAIRQLSVRANHRRLPGAGTMAPRYSVRSIDHLFRILLHCHRFQSNGCRRKHEKGRRLYSWHPPRPEDRGVY